MADLATDQTITYNAIPTNIGLTKIQLAMTTGRDLVLATLAYGDGGGSTPTPSPDQTTLVNQIGSTDILGHEEDLEDNVTWYSGIIEAGNASGTLRELGLFDEDGNLCFVGNIPDITLPEAVEGVAINLPIQLGIKNYYSKYITIKTHIKVVEQIEGSGGYSLFDLVQKDHILGYDETEGFALQGTWVHKQALDQEYYGYPDFIQKCIDEKNQLGTITRRIQLGDQTITGYVNPNGHIFYDVDSDKSKVDAYFGQTGVAWFWGIDENGEDGTGNDPRVFLPRNNYFFKNSFMEPGSFRPNLAQDFDPGKYNSATLPSLAHLHGLTQEAAGSHTHVTSIAAAGNHKHSISIGSASLNFSHSHSGGSLKVTITGTGILSSSRLTNLVKNGTINTRYVSKGVTYRNYYNNFYSGAIYMDPARTELKDTYFNDGGGDGSMLTRSNASFPDINDDSQGSNGGLVRFNSARSSQSWSGYTSTASLSGSHTHTVDETTAGEHVHTATQEAAGSHTHVINIQSSDPVSANLLGDTVTPPSVNLLLYIVVGNVRRRAAIVIDQKLEEALEEIQEAADEAVARVDAAVTPALETIEEAVTDAKEEINTVATEVEQEIQGKVDEAEQFADISREQAEISEYWAGISTQGQIQSNWTETDPNRVDYIKNKPEVDWANLVYLSAEQTLTNKTINAQDNNIENIGFNNLVADLIVTSIGEETASNNTFATSQAIFDAIKYITIKFSNLDPEIVLTEITNNNANNATIATSRAIYNLISNAVQSILEIPIVNMGVTNSVENLNVVSNQTVPTSLAVYRAILNSMSTGIRIIGDQGVTVDTTLNTNVDVQSTNSDLVVISYYSGHQEDLGVLIYTFTYYGSQTILSSVSTATSSNTDLQITCSYNVPGTEVGTVSKVFTYSEENGWLDELDEPINLNSFAITIDSGTPQEGDTITLTTVTTATVIPAHWQIGDETVQLADYYLTIESGTPQAGDQILLTYTTTSTTVISADLEEIASLVDYTTLKNRPNYVFAEGLKSEQHLNTETTINSSNQELQITSSYIPIVEGEISYSFEYTEDEDDPANTGWYENGALVDLANYDLTVSGTPQNGDTFTITYTTTKYTYVSSNIEYTDGLSSVAALQTVVNATCSNEEVQVVSSYTGTQAQEGTITYKFRYQEETGQLTTTEQIECSNPNLTINSSYIGPESTIGTKVYQFEYEERTSLSTSTQVNCSNPDVSVVSTYTGTQGEEGTINYSFTYRDYEWSGETLYAWFLNDQDLVDDMALQYNLQITGEPVVGDTISLTYTTTTHVDYLGWVYYDELGNVEDVDLADFDLTVSGTPAIGDTITVTHITSGTVRYYWVDDNTGDEVNLANYDLTIYGEPDVDDTINLVYITAKGKVTVSLDAITQTPTTSSTKVATTKYSRNLQTYQPITTFSGGSIVLQDDVSVYSASAAITAATTFTFNTSNLNYLSSSVFYTFEVKFTMSTVSTLSFPANVIWQDGETPTFEDAGTYLLAFRTMDAGSTFIGNVQGKW